MLENLIVFASVAAAALFLTWKYSPASLKRAAAGVLAESGPALTRDVARQWRERLVDKADHGGCSDCSGCADGSAARVAPAPARARVIMIRKDPGNSL